MQQPKLDVRRIEDGIYGWGLYREDQTKAIIKGISKTHAQHLKKICLRMVDLPDTIQPVKDWYNYEEIVGVGADGNGIR